MSAALRELGWVEGRNLTLEPRFADGNSDRLPTLAAELVGLNPHAIVAATNLAARALQIATRSIPIVVVAALDPVGTGIARTLARPGGNITGVLWADPAFSAKTVQLLKEAIPQMQRVGVLYPANYPGSESYVDAMEEAARTLGVTLYRFPVARSEDVAAALIEAKKAGIEALRIQAVGPVSASYAAVREFVAANKIPDIYTAPEYVEGGGFMSHAPRRSDTAGRAAAILDKMLKGAKPADLPFEYPTRTELVINIKAAKHRGIAVPSSILLRADRVIE